MTWMEKQYKKIFVNQSLRNNCLTRVKCCIVSLGSNFFRLANSSLIVKQISHFTGACLMHSQQYINMHPKVLHEFFHPQNECIHFKNNSNGQFPSFLVNVQRCLTGQKESKYKPSLKNMLTFQYQDQPSKRQ